MDLTGGCSARMQGQTSTYSSCTLAATSLAKERTACEASHTSTGVDRNYTHKSNESPNAASSDSFCPATRNVGLLTSLARISHLQLRWATRSAGPSELQ